MKTYQGKRFPPYGAMVRVIDMDGGKRELNPGLHIVNLSPTGVEWGYGGSGPAQLAWALLADATGDVKLASRCYQAFKWAFVAGWGETWTVTETEIMAFVAAQEAALCTCAKIGAGDWGEGSDVGSMQVKNVLCPLHGNM